MNMGRGYGPGEGEFMDRKWQVLIVTSLGTFMAFLDTTIANIAFTAISRDFSTARLSDLSWVLTGYTVLFAASLIPAGRIADLAGRRRVFLIGLAIFIVASALSGLAPGPWWLIAARCLQGVGAAAMTPAALGLVLAEFPAERRGTAIGLWSLSGSLAGAAGTPLGGAVVELWGWRWCFLLNVPVGLAAIVLGTRILTERREPVGARLPDLIGAAALAGAVAALSLGIVKGADWGWTGPRTLGAFAVAALLTAAFIARSGSHPAPVMDLSLWRVRSFSVANVATLFYAMGFFAMFLSAALFLTSVWRYSTIRAGLAIAPGPFTAGIVGMFAGRLVDRVGQRALLVPGQLIFAVGLAWLGLQTGREPHFLTLWLPAFVLTGIGVGMTIPCLSSAAVAELPPSRYATGGAVNSTARQVGAALGVALLVAIIGRPGPDSALDAFHRGFYFSAACSLACAAVALALGRVRVRTPEPAPVSTVMADPAG